MSRANRRVIFLLTLLVGLPWLVGFTFPGGLQRLWRQADRAFKRQQYDRAEQLYDQARQQQPDDWRLAFNTAVAQAAGKKLDVAAKGFEKIAASGPQELREPAEYNAGNCYLAQQQKDQAIEHYKRALYLNPNDMNAKWNLELAKRQQKQDQQQKQQQNQRQKQDQKKQSQQQKQDQRKPQQPQPQDRKMDKDEARRLLQSLSQADRDLQKKMARQRQQPSREAPPTKDW